MQTPTAPEPDTLLTLADLREHYGISFTRQHLLRLENQGRFPRRLRLGERTVRWRSREVAAWLEQRIAEREEERPAAAGGVR